MNRKPDQSGFTLVEVLAALAVIAIAMTAVIKSLGQSIDTTIALRERTVALWIAQNNLARHFAEHDWPATGETTGTTDMAGRTWYWTERVSAVPDNPNMRRLEVEVRTAAGQPYVSHLVGALRKPI
jgi:general secretion pathway protein I